MRMHSRGRSPHQRDAARRARRRPACILTLLGVKMGIATTFLHVHAFLCIPLHFLCANVGDRVRKSFG